MMILIIDVMFCFTSTQQVVKAQSTITIYSDGSFSPANAPLQHTEINEGRINYWITSEIFDSAIIIQRDYVKIDGRSHSLSGNSAIYAGIELQEVQGVVVENLKIEGFENGVKLHNSGTCQILNNTIIGNQHSGIRLTGFSHWNNIQRNTIKDNDGDGISLNDDSSYSTIVNNIIESNQVGIEIRDTSKGNSIANNAFINNIRQFGDFNNQVNYWNSDYENSNGNYWSDYIARFGDMGDSFSGENQLQPGEDGIWDHPYYIYGSTVKDNYPLVKYPSAITCYTSGGPSLTCINQK